MRYSLADILRFAPLVVALLALGGDIANGVFGRSGNFGVSLASLDVLGFLGSHL
jgi:hypothetical protein